MFTLFIRAVEACNTLISRDLKRNLFNLFASWSGQYSKPLGISSNILVASVNMEEEKLQFSSLQVIFIVNNCVYALQLLFTTKQAMSALLCCGSCFDTQNLIEDGNIYSWIDSLLTSSDDKVC